MDLYVLSTVLATLIIVFFLHKIVEVVFESLLLPGLQHTRFPYSSLSPGVWSNSHPLRQWPHPNIYSFLPPSPPVLNLSQHHSLFSSQLFSIRWPKYWNFSFSIHSSNEYSMLISLRIDWFDLLAAWGTLKSLLQYLSSKSSILWHSAFFMDQLSYLLTTGKTIVLTILTFVCKVMSLLFNKLSRKLCSSNLKFQCLTGYLIRNYQYVKSWLYYIAFIVC